MLLVLLIQFQRTLESLDAFGQILLLETFNQRQIGTVHAAIVLVVEILEQLRILLLAVRLEQMARQWLVVDNPEKLAQLVFALQVQNNMVN